MLHSPNAATKGRSGFVRALTLGKDIPVATTPSHAAYVACKPDEYRGSLRCETVILTPCSRKIVDHDPAFDFAAKSE